MWFLCLHVWSYWNPVPLFAEPLSSGGLIYSLCYNQELKVRWSGLKCVSFPFTWRGRNPFGPVAQGHKLTAAPVASMRAVADTHLGGGVGLLHWKESNGALPQLSVRNQRQHPFVCYYWKTVCCIRHLFWRFINKPFRLEIMEPFSRSFAQPLWWENKRLLSLLTTWHTE